MSYVSAVKLLDLLFKFHTLKLQGLKCIGLIKIQNVK